MKLVTWNVDSLKVRLPRVLEFLDEHAPDIVCMQETKSEASAFPLGELAAAGYDAVHHAVGRWAGVAIAPPRSRARRSAHRADGRTARRRGASPPLPGATKSVF